MPRGGKKSKKGGSAASGPVREVSEQHCERPLPRSHFSFTACNNDTAVLYGGEYNDGREIHFYDEVRARRAFWLLMPPTAPHQPSLQQSSRESLRLFCLKRYFASSSIR